MLSAKKALGGTIKIFFLIVFATGILDVLVKNTINPYLTTAIVSYAIVGIYTIRVGKEEVIDYLKPLDSGDALIAFFIGGVLCVITSAITLATAAIFHLSQIAPIPSVQLLDHIGWLGLVFTLFIGPVVEEMFFRGFVQKGLVNSMSAPKAIFISSLIYALFHFDDVRFVPLMIAGAILGLMYHKKENLVYPITTHIAWNAIGTIISFI